MTPTLHMSVVNVMLSKLITSGATNSGVPNITCQPTNQSAMFLGHNSSAV